MDAARNGVGKSLLMGLRSGNSRAGYLPPVPKRPLQRAFCIYVALRDKPEVNSSEPGRAAPSEGRLELYVAYRSDKGSCLGKAWSAEHEVHFVYA
jgi:hypothetical protein